MFFWRTKDQAEVDIVLARGADIIAGIEIKSSREISSADLTGLRSLSQDYPEFKAVIVTRLANSFDLDFANVLPYQEYFKRLKSVL